MRAKDRFLRMLRGLPTDRVPLELAGFQFASHEAVDAHADPRHHAIARRVFEEQTFCVGVPGYVNRYLVMPLQRIRTTEKPLANGNTLYEGAIDTPRGALSFVTEYSQLSDTSWTLKYPVESPRDLRRLASVPWESAVGLCAPNVTELPSGFGERGLLATRISSPFVRLSGAMSFQSFLAMTATDLALLIEFTEVCRRRILDVLSALVSKPGLELVWLGGSEWVTPPMASPAVHDALVQERSLIVYAHSHSDALV